MTIKRWFRLQPVEQKIPRGRAGEEGGVRGSAVAKSGGEIGRWPGPSKGGGGGPGVRTAEGCCGYYRLSRVRAARRRRERGTEGFLGSVVDTDRQDRGHAEQQHRELPALALVGLVVQARQQVAEGDVQEACGGEGEGVGDQGPRVGQ